MVLLTFYETAEKVKLRLGNAGIDVEQRLKEGSLIIADAAKEIFGENKNLLQFLLNTERHVKRMGKGFVSVIVSMGAFFLYEKEEEVQEYEGLLMQDQKLESAVLLSQGRLWQAFRSSNAEIARSP